jgi:hypothetical protein
MVLILADGTAVVESFAVANGKVMRVAVNNVPGERGR